MKNKRISHLVFILILFLCAAILLGGKWIYDVNIAYRLESHSARHCSLIFEPFSGKLFDIDLDMVKTVFIQKQCYYNSRGSTILPNTDAYREYYGNLERYVVRFDEAVPEKRKAAVKAINAFRYHAWLPYNWNPVHEPWYLPHFVILFYDGTGLTGYLKENCIWVGECESEVGDHLLEDGLNGAWYYGGRDLYDALMALE